MPSTSKEAEPNRTRTLRTWAEVDLAALRRNADLCRACSSAGDLLAVIKANAYGHGIGPIARALRDRVWGFGVATLAEAETVVDSLSDDSVRPPILLLSPLLPAEREDALRLGLSVPVSSIGEVEAFEGLTAAASRHLGVHAVIDTGMGRMGALPEEAPALLEAIARSPHLALEGLATHFPSADTDLAFSRTQITQFQQILERGRDAGWLTPATRLHLGNSAALLQLAAELDFATLHRPGLALYGASPLPTPVAGLSPVLSLHTRVTQVRVLPAGHGIGYSRTFVTERPTRVATLAIGYGDGYLRHLSGQGTEVLLRGRRRPLLGVVTMDQVVIEADAEVKVGDIATLIGSDGEESITVEELASRSGTIPWEVLTGLTERVPRVYLDA